MLVITRHEGQQVDIGDPNDPIGTVKVAQIRGDRIRLSFDFPRHIQVHRQEVADRIRAGEAREAPAPSVERGVVDA